MFTFTSLALQVVASDADNPLSAQRFVAVCKQGERTIWEETTQTAEAATQTAVAVEKARP